VTVLLIAAMSSLIYAGPALWQTWTHDGPTLITDGSEAIDGFVAGHDFVAFYSASLLALNDEAPLVYSENRMAQTQREVVGHSTVGYLGFMYPPTYVLMITPLSTLPYFTALGLWLLLPLCAFLYALARGTDIPPAALLLVIAAPAVTQSLFAGQNGLLFAALLAGGLLWHDSRSALAGVLLGFATAKPHLAILIFPALIAGRHWTVLAYAAGTLATLIGLTTVVFGMEIWTVYAAIPDLARDWLATGRLPWPRMPTIYTAARLAGTSDVTASAIQALSGLLVLGSVIWIWTRRRESHLRCAALLAGVPLITPFLYDYDLPFMLLALGLFITDATTRGWRAWEKPLLLLVWLQPVWWWTLSTVKWEFSIAPLIYGLFFIAILQRATGLPTRNGTANTKEEGAAIP
jgi:hypothetical protein